MNGEREGSAVRAWPWSLDPGPRTLNYIRPRRPWIRHTSCAAMV
jgi:hypothetical protein